LLNLVLPKSEIKNGTSSMGRLSMLMMVLSGMPKAEIVMALVTARTLLKEWRSPTVLQKEWQLEWMPTMVHD
jgi:hypothetical protein